MDDLKKDQAKDKGKIPAQTPSMKEAVANSKNEIPVPTNPAQPLVSKGTENSAADKKDSVPAAKVPLSGVKNSIPDSASAAVEAGKEVPVADAPQTKGIVPNAQNMKEVPKRDSEANWSFSNISQNAQETATVDNADLLELSRQLGTPARR